MKPKHISRMQLKQDLMTSRTVFTKEGWKPECAYCGKPIMQGGEMHETIVTRGDIRMARHLHTVVMHRCNCSIVHSECHQEAATKEGTQKVIKHIIKHEGKDAVLNWLYNMRVELRGSAEIDALIQYIKEEE